MKTKIIAILISLLFLAGCGHVSLKDNTTQVSIDIAASTIGYVAGQKNLDKIDTWNKWIDQILALEAGASTASYEKLLAIAFDAVCDDPFLAMQFEKLTKLLDFPELQPPDLPYLKAEYVELVKLVMGGLKDGLVAAQAQKTSALKEKLRIAPAKAARETDKELDIETFRAKLWERVVTNRIEFEKQYPIDRE